MNTTHDNPPAHTDSITFEEWRSLLPDIDSINKCSDAELRSWYADDEARGGLKRTESIYGYVKYEALTYSGGDLFYIDSVCGGENSSDFFVRAINPDYRVPAYDWYTKEQLEHRFKRLGMTVFEALAKARLAA